MRLATVVARGTILLLAVVAACSDDDDSAGIQCGTGTVLQGDTCVAIGGQSAGGKSTTGGKPTTGGSSTAGTSSTGPGSAGESNAGSGGTLGDAGGAGSSVALGGVAGEDSGVGMAGGGGDAPVAVPPVAPPRWLVFAHPKGVFAYDTTLFPASEGLVTLSSKLQGPDRNGVLWSPDGRTLIYRDQGDFYAVDMAGDAPGTPRLLLTNPLSPSHEGYALLPLAWSGDSQSAVVLSGSTLSVFDPMTAAPTLEPLTTTLKFYAWAPVGNRLLYVDESGTYSVQVTDGAPGTPIELDASATIWSPAGDQLAGVKDGDLGLTTLGVGSAAFELLTEAHAHGEGAAGAGGAPPVIPVDPIPPLGAYSITFSPDGSKLAFNGVLVEGEERNGFIVDVKPTLGEPLPVVSDTPAGTPIGCSVWSPDSRLLFCGAGEFGMFAADPGGGDPITVPLLHTTQSWTWSPNADLHQLFFNDIEAPNLSMVDLGQPDTLVPLADGFVAYSVNPAGTLVGYVDEHVIKLVNLAAPDDPPVSIQTSPSAFTAPVWTWSPDGQFIAIADGAHQQRLVRIDGAQASTPVSLAAQTTGDIYFGWQP